MSWFREGARVALQALTVQAPKYLKILGSRVVFL